MTFRAPSHEAHAPPHPPGGYPARDRPECRLRHRQPGRGSPSRRSAVRQLVFGSRHGRWFGGGVAISKDTVRAEAAVGQARDDRILADYDTLRNQGQLSTDDYGTLTSGITSAEDPTQLYSDALKQLQENLTLAQYADKHNVSVTDADIDAQIVKDGTLPELRHVKVIGVAPEVTPPSAVATSDQLAAAQGKAQAYLDEIKAGAQWDDVFTSSQSGGAASSTGDLGLSAQSRVEPGSRFRPGDLRPEERQRHHGYVQGHRRRISLRHRHADHTGIRGLRLEGRGRLGLQLRRLPKCRAGGSDQGRDPEVDREPVRDRVNGQAATSSRSTSRPATVSSAMGLRPRSS